MKSLSKTMKNIIYSLILIYYVINNIDIYFFLTYLSWSYDVIVIIITIMIIIYCYSCYYIHCILKSKEYTTNTLWILYIYITISFSKMDADLFKEFLSDMIIDLNETDYDRDNAMIQIATLTIETLLSSLINNRSNIKKIYYLLYKYTLLSASEATIDLKHPEHNIHVYYCPLDDMTSKDREVLSRTKPALFDPHEYLHFNQEFEDTFGYSEPKQHKSITPAEHYFMLFNIRDYHLLIRAKSCLRITYFILHKDDPDLDRIYYMLILLNRRPIYNVNIALYKDKIMIFVSQIIATLKKFEIQINKHDTYKGDDYQLTLEDRDLFAKNILNTIVTYGEQLLSDLEHLDDEAIKRVRIKQKL